MESKITLCGQEIAIKSSAYTPLAYESMFNRVYIEDIDDITKELNKLTKIDDPTDLDKILEIDAKIGQLSIKTLKLVYIMALESKSITTSFEEWTSQLEGIDDDPTWIRKTLDTGRSTFRRQ